MTQCVTLIMGENKLPMTMSLFLKLTVLIFFFYDSIIYFSKIWTFSCECNLFLFIHHRFRHVIWTAICLQSKIKWIMAKCQWILTGFNQSDISLFVEFDPVHLNTKPFIKLNHFSFNGEIHIYSMCFGFGETLSLL